MAVITQKKSRRKKHLLKKFIGFLIIIAVIAGVGLGAVLLFNLGGDTPGANSLRKISLDSVQTQLEDQTWISQVLLPLNDYSRPGTKLHKINALVIHYVGNPGTTAAQNRTYYSTLADTHETSASSNFLIGLNGEILECVPADEVAYCSNGRNNDTLSIECCHPDVSGKFTAATNASLVQLTAYLCTALGLDSSDVIRHYDVTKKECPKYFVDHPDAWKQFRADVHEAMSIKQPISSVS